MLFNSVTYFIFFLIVFYAYWFLFNRKLIWRNLLLVVTGFVFYGWWDWRFLYLLWFTSSVDFLTAKYIAKSSNHATRRILLTITLVINLSVLGFFKYFNFFYDSVVTTLHHLGLSVNTFSLQVILPIGISFYTFQSIAYVVDVYRQKLEACDSYITFLSFVSFFPQLVAGPISRPNDLLTQFYTTSKFLYPAAVSGLRLILFGLFKKVVIADTLALYVDEVFNHPEAYNGGVVALSVVAFAFQIYGDFSGYSDMARGSAKLLGFDLVKNFKGPYWSLSFKEFWQRWHISLSTWFRDYLYIPLGGNKTTVFKRYTNLMITFLVSGLWHGANWTFVVWGGIHGLMLVAEDGIKQTIKWSAPNWAKRLLVFCIVTLAWIFFRANNVQDALTLIQHLFIEWSLVDVLHSLNSVYGSFRLVICLCVLLLMAIYLDRLQFKQQLKPTLDQLPMTLRWLIYCLFVILIIIFGANDNAPNFIYFKF